MRPIIDVNNQPYSDEFRVYNSRSRLIFKFVFLFLIVGISFYLFGIENGYIGSVLLLVLAGFMIKKIFKSISQIDVVQLRINSNGIQIQNDPIISWDKVEKERMITIKSGKYSVHDFVFYDANNNKEMRFRVEDFGIDAMELEKSAKMHRERFNRKNNPS